MSANLSVHDLTVTRGAQPVLDRVDLTVAPGRRIGVVGPNGVGKSTLLAACAGAIAPDAGAVRLVPPAATVGWLHQEPERTGETVRALLARRTGVTGAQAELDTASEAVAAGEPGSAERYDVALQRWLALGAADLDARMGVVAAEVGLGEQLLDQPTRDLSGGENARVGLAALLLSRFDVYLLDEPTNDLDLDGLDRLERWVLGTPAPMLLVSHDRRFLDRVVTDVAEIDEFSHRLILFGGGWAAYLDERERTRRHAWERFEAYDTERRSLAARAQRQREWAQQGRAKVRRSGETDKFIRAFKIDQTEQLAGKAAQTKRVLDRLEAVDKPREPWQLRLDVPDAGRSGDIVIRLLGATVERGDFVLGPIDVLIAYGERVALVGGNGAGKTTLIDLGLGRIEPSAGTARLGAGVVVGEIEQVRRQLDGAGTLLRSFVDATGMTIGDVRTLLAKFGLVGAHVERPTASLSPGERTRASLALLMATGANLLVLDEPTNHLDLPAIEQLEQALDTFEGTVLLVTHDRELLDRVRITRTLRLDGGRLV
ncbi:MAG: ABC-F family ATP-binding cassette domain-containing protein [Ilumatobacter sp.]|uniref:ABC-F family ATP-binding cassette domain-containing protein n=1 Tax=Ilumatobacter sp. TaxID=1967498 RepID=UPI0026323077|nr:ABC-F family ATP-binding cassette domain-containing protein [Ilumatobacter sp.]MDJ0769702.1 ABC-F family ATP-binding cassette domain-containing protein [Ilumatobacter sp.]